MKKLSIVIILIAFSFSLALFGCTQNGAIKDEVEKLKQEQKNIIKELAEVKKLLQAKKAPSPQRAEFKEVDIDITGDPFAGDKLAKVTLIEFYDFQ